MLKFLITCILFLFIIGFSNSNTYSQQDILSSETHCSNNSILNKFLDSKTNNVIIVVGKGAALSDIEAAELIKNKCLT